MALPIRWSPYRKGVALALLYWGGCIPMFFWGIMVIGRGVRFSLYPLLAFGLPWLAAGIAWNTGFPRCPNCSKSLFAFHMDDFGPVAVRTGLVWPEESCSKCGYDLAESGDEA
jgi:ribosomal protein S27AE